VAEKDLDLSFTPQMLEGNTRSLVGAGRLSGKKKLSDDELEAYVDVMGMRGQDDKVKFSTPNVGARYKKQLGKDSSLEFYGEKRAKGSPDSWQAGVKYEREFKKGGAVKSASARADGIAQRGKTKGRVV